MKPNERKSKILKKYNKQKSLESHENEYTSIRSLLEIMNFDEIPQTQVIILIREVILLMQTGITFSQNIFDAIMFSSFFYPECVLYLFQLYGIVPKPDWVFYSLSSFMTLYPEKFLESLTTNPHIWEFLAVQFENDIKDHKEVLKTNFIGYQDSLLIEALFYYWPGISEDFLYPKLSQEIIFFLFKNLKFDSVRKILGFLGIFFPYIALNVLQKSLYILDDFSLKIIIEKTSDNYDFSDQTLEFAIKIHSFYPDLSLNIVQNLTKEEKDIYQSKFHQNPGQYNLLFDDNTI